MGRSGLASCSCGVMPILSGRTGSKGGRVRHPRFGGVGSLSGHGELPAARALSLSSRAAAPSSIPKSLGRERQKLGARGCIDGAKESAEFQFASDVRTPRTALLPALLRTLEPGTLVFDTPLHAAGALQAGQVQNPESVIEAEDFSDNGPFHGQHNAQTIVSLTQLAGPGENAADAKELPSPNATTPTRPA